MNPIEIKINAVERAHFYMTRFIPGELTDEVHAIVWTAYRKGYEDGAGEALKQYQDAKLEEKEGVE